MRAIVYCLAVAMLSLLPRVAPAQTLSDEDYVSRYFGTVARFSTPSQAVSPETGWWGDLVPQELSYNYAYIAGVVNTRRADKGITPLLNPAEALVVLGEELPGENGGYTYSIEFLEMRPSEVEAVLNMMGGAGKVLPGSTVSYEPLSRRYLYASAGPDGIARLNVAGRTLSINLNGPAGSPQQQIAGELRTIFGRDVPHETYISSYRYFDGTTGADVSLSIDFNASTEPIDRSYSGEGGM
jgi:hypothetical protein